MCVFQSQKQNSRDHQLDRMFPFFPGTDGCRRRDVITDRRCGVFIGRKSGVIAGRHCDVITQWRRDVILARGSARHEQHGRRHAQEAREVPSGGGLHPQTAGRAGACSSARARQTDFHFDRG